MKPGSLPSSGRTPLIATSMKVTSTDRDELVRRVTRRLHGTPVRPTVVRDAVERVLEALPSRMPAAAPSMRLVVVHRAGMPDLSSRLRATLPADARAVEFALATEGRHTVVVARGSEVEVSAIQEAATKLGAFCTIRDDA